MADAVVKALAGRPPFALLGVLALFFTACGGSGGDTKTVTVSSAQDEKTPSAGQATTPGGNAPSSPDAATAPALAARDGSTTDGNPLRVEIVELKRSGSTVALTLRLTTRSDRTFDIEDTFDDGVEQVAKPAAGSGAVDSDRRNAYSVDGIALVDSKNARKHLVGRDAEGNCLCDVDLYTTSLSSEGPLLLSATFAAPPAGVKAMDVFVPRFGTFKNVTLQE